jgi:hypothetical protein
MKHDFPLPLKGPPALPATWNRTRLIVMRVIQLLHGPRGVLPGHTGRERQTGPLPSSRIREERPDRALSTPESEERIACSLPTRVRLRDAPNYTEQAHAAMVSRWTMLNAFLVPGRQRGRAPRKS